MPTNLGRKTTVPAEHYVAISLTPASAAGGIIGWLPAGAMLNGVHVLTVTPFNSTTNTVAVGLTAGGAELAAAGSIAAVARTDASAAVAVAGPTTGPTPIYYTLASTGAAPTAGQAVVWVDYLAWVG